MKHLFLSAALACLACPILADGHNEATAVKVWDRDWIVAPVEDEPGFYSAIRLNPEQKVFLGPARTRTSQAIRAYQMATGCRADLDSMYQIITGEFRAKLICPAQ